MARSDFEEIEALYKSIRDIEAIKMYHNDDPNRPNKIDQTLNFLRTVKTSEFDEEYQDIICDAIKRALMVVHGTKVAQMNRKIGITTDYKTDYPDVDEKIKKNMEEYDKNVELGVLDMDETRPLNMRFPNRGSIPPRNRVMAEEVEPEEVYDEDPVDLDENENFTEEDPNYVNGVDEDQ